MSILVGGILIASECKNEIYSPLETCSKGIESVLSHGATTELVHESVLKDLEGVKFKAEGITLVKLINSYECDVVVKDIKGHRSYRVSLEKNTKYPHLYRVLNVKGQKIISEYQWK